MNEALMSKYIEFVADHLLGSLGVAKLYNTENPFDFMELISLEGKQTSLRSELGRTEGRGDEPKVEDNCFDLDADFNLSITKCTLKHDHLVS